MSNNNSSRDAFRSRFGFIMSCIGSAVGMGCIWLFPYRVGQYGGFAFLVPFLIFVIGLGFCGVSAGTKHPICANSVINAVWRSKADLPAILGPVIMIIC